MFVIFALLFTYGVIGIIDRANYFATHIDQYAELSVRQRPLLSTIFGAMQIVGVLACLVFMWQVRHSKAE